LTSRERVLASIKHQQPDRVPLDLGSCPTTGMHVSTVYLLRQALKLDEPDTPVKIIEPYQMLGEIKPDLRDVLGVDVVGVFPIQTALGINNENWKEWELFDGTPVAVPGDFNTEPDENGDIYSWPGADRSVPASAKMPNGGFYFDTIVRQEPLDESKLDPADNLEEYQPLSDENISYFKTEIDRLYTETDKAVMVNFGGTAFGDIAHVPAPSLKHPKGIRDIEEWYVSLVIRPDYIKEVFRRQSEIALANLQRLYAAIGDKEIIVYMSGTDFGTQKAPFMSLNTYKNLYLPYQKKLNDWIHENTPWKTFQHSCGSVMPLIEGFIEAGFDILNPVQTSAVNMDARELKKKFGKQITFWGGGIDSQKTLPFGTPDQVREAAENNIKILCPGGGFVFNPIHNVQARVPVENLLAMYEAFEKHRNYKDIG